MLFPMGVLLKHAYAHRYALGSFDVPNLETAAAVLESAQEAQAPVIIAYPETFFPFNRPEVMIAAVRQMAEPLDIPVAIILDHGQSFESCMRAMRCGMTTVMLDASTKPLAENVALTQAVVRAAHAIGVTVEAEVGHVGRNADFSVDVSGIDKTLTRPEDAREFVQSTGVDCLAVAVGTAHGHYKGTPTIHFDLLDRINAELGIPLVLHGGSSTGDQRLQQSIQHGVAKVNIYTDMAHRAKELVEALLAEKNPAHRINDVLAVTRKGFKEVSNHYIRLFGGAGRAEMAIRFAKQA